MINFINIFIEENGQPPAFNIFESCERVAKRLVMIFIRSSSSFLFSSSDQLDSNENSNEEKSSRIQLNELS